MNHQGAKKEVTRAGGDIGGFGGDMTAQQDADRNRWQLLREGRLNE
ncbi:MAG: hypothetical protein ABI305_05925 [Tepidiformaceae bacterium]